MRIFLDHYWYAPGFSFEQASKIIAYSSEIVCTILCFIIVGAKMSVPIVTEDKMETKRKTDKKSLLNYCDTESRKYKEEGKEETTKEDWISQKKKKKNKKKDGENKAW